jgi:hypothetical protein
MGVKTLAACVQLEELHLGSNVTKETLVDLQNALSALRVWTHGDTY